MTSTPAVEWSVHPPSAEDIFSAAPLAMILVDQAGRIVRVNAAAEVLFNMSAQMLDRRILTDIVSVQGGLDTDHEGAFAAYDILVDLPRGRIHADVLVNPTGDKGGWRVVSIHSGAAAHRMRQQRDRTPSQAAVRIAAMLAHEIKNPLAGIRGAAQLLGRGLDDKAVRLTRLIRDEVDRITNLIDRMEGFTDTRPLICKSENIYAIIDHARTLAQSGFGDRLHIREVYDPSLPPVLVHRDSLVQIILNLLKNAAETVDGEQVRTVQISTAFRHGVSFSSSGRGEKQSLPIELCIADDGPGAPLEIVENLFDPFVSSKVSGHGLGLSLVDKLVRDMGGIIQYERVGEPQMTIFRILLPRGLEQNQ